MHKEQWCKCSKNESFNLLQ